MSCRRRCQLVEVTEALLPRRYQEEIFSRAQERNVIAALDTGSGKTYISTLLIKWIVTRDAGQGKVTVFLVPKVALVDQQGDFIAKETGLRVSKRYGSTAIDMTDRRGWRTEIENHDVLVMTAQIFLNILTHSHWTVDKVSLIVFDECHHTRKNHAYNGIMREYYQCSPETRPKIFGMTASPIWNPRDAAESLATLERNLDAKVIAVREHIAELSDHSPKPQEIVHEYPTSPLTYPDYPSTNLWESLGLSNLPPEIDIPVDKLRTRYDVTYHSLGPYGAELFLYHEIKHRIVQFATQAESEMEYINAIPYEAIPLPEIELPQDLQDMQTVLAHCKDFFEDENDPDIVPVRVETSWCSPKVILLAQLLFDHYSPTFQGIVFVEQRHVAMCLSRMLPRIPPLELYFKSAQLIGHGAGSVQRSHARGMALRTQKDVVEMFRNRDINLLVATSVAEEGLDFPACELVIRFDPIQHMVGYIQSRGRARQKMAVFVVMVQQGQTLHLERYKDFSESEPQLRLVYQSRDDGHRPTAEEELEEGEEREDPEDPLDLAERERYVVASTGAILTYNTSIGLLNHLCSLIPRDRFTPIHLPQYSGDFESNLSLPTSLPLPPEDLKFVGPPRRTKKEAKRAVAFLAVKRLHQLGVFDDYLLPSRPSTGDNEDADGRTIADVSNVPETMEVMVRDPWTKGSKQWLHLVSLDGRPTAGLITGSNLPPADVVYNGTYVSAAEGELVEFDLEDEWRQRRALEDFMRMGLWWCITGRGIALPLTCYLVPITDKFEVDWDTIYAAVANLYGVSDWSNINEAHCNRKLVICTKEFGRPFILRRIRDDLTPMSKPPAGSREASASTYHEFYTKLYTRKTVPEIPEDGPCIELQPFPRHTATAYALNGSYKATQNTPASQISHVLPRNLCRWSPLSESLYHTFHCLPPLLHRLTDLYRARAARIELGLPSIVDDLLVQALTLPNANAGFNNQRLETLGDSVLKLCTVVHLYNRFPHRHEGQLDVLRRNSVSNRTLLARAKEIQLEQYLTSEPQTMRVWRYSLPADSELALCDKPSRFVHRRIPKRSLQDCMEATLGASYATGGIDMALRAGTALGLSFGGTLPWNARYGGQLPVTPVSPLFTELQEITGYRFKCGRLLAEAVTHPSFRSTDSSTYQRLEFLGDALIDLVVMTYLHNKFPTADSGQLSWARSRAVCAPALAWVAVNKLILHRILLINNVELSMAIKKYVDIFESTPCHDIVAHGWKHDPPKALSDVLESVLGAAFVDMDYNFEKTTVMVETILQDLLAVLSPKMPRDPVSELMVWTAKAGCRKISFRKSQSRLDIKRNDSISVIVHDFAVVGPVTASNMSLAKGLAAERARQVLSDEESPHLLSRICDCDQAGAVQEDPDQEVLVDAPVEQKKLDDETEEGFAALAQKVLTEVIGAKLPEIDDSSMDNITLDEEEEEVAMLLEKSEPNGATEEPNAYRDDEMDIDSDSGEVGHLARLSSSMEI